MEKFKVGDIVKPNPKAWLFDRKIAESIVEAVVRKSSPYTFSVEVTKVKESGKQYLNQEIICQTGHDGFELVKRGACKRELHITTDGTTTHAVLKEGGKVVKRAKAVCSPDDEYRFETGARLAVDRVFGKETEKKEPKFKFEIGDHVVVKDKNEAFPFFKDFVAQYDKDTQLLFAYGHCPKNGDHYTVIKRGLHPETKAPLYLIQPSSNTLAFGELYLIGERGLASLYQ